MKQYFMGWRLTGLISVLLMANFVGILFYYQIDEDSVRHLIRSTARTSFVLFMLAFSASSLYLFWKNNTNKWILSNRRYLGVSFAVSHFLHLLALFMMLNPIQFNVFLDRGILPTLVGATAYAFIAIMAITSFEKGRKLLSPTNWKRVHTIGSYLIWIIFAKSYLLTATESYLNAIFAAILVFVMVIRMIKLWRSAKP